MEAERHYRMGRMAGLIDDYDRWRSMDYRPVLSELPAEHLAPYLQSGQRALEIGCNRGQTTLWLASHGLEVVGIDINSKAIAHAREQAKKLANMKARFLEGDFLGQADIGNFDLIVMIRVLTCFSRVEDWHVLLNRCFECLSGEGLIYIHDFVMAPQYESYRERYSEGARRGWRTGNFAVPGREGGMLFVAHHHSIEEITLIANRYEKMLLNFHDSISLNGNACRMFEFLGKRSRMALTGGVFGAEQGLAS
jgi:cyclopropane fatty-acyl-phospholipid synthase-like methyltransferase